MTYRRLTDVLAGYWEKPWGELPEEQQQAWSEIYRDGPDNYATVGQEWDGQSAAERKRMVEEHDCQKDPADAKAIDLGFWSAVARKFGTVDWEYWLSLQSWESRDAACLLTVLDPREYDKAAANNNPQPVGLVRRIADIERRADREQKAGLLGEHPSPSEWAVWAEVGGYALPKSLRPCCTPSSIDDVLWNRASLVREKKRQIADWEGMHHHGIPSEAKLRSDTLTKLRAELKVIDQAPPGAALAAKLADGGEAASVSKVGAGGTAKAKAKGGRKPGPARELLRRILDELEKWAAAADEPFDRLRMPGPLGKNANDTNSFHWLCARISPLVFTKAATTFEKHRAGLCAIAEYAKPSDFYRRALPHIAPKIASGNNVSKIPVKRRKAA